MTKLRLGQPKYDFRKSSTYVYKYLYSLHIFVVFIMKDSATITNQLVHSFAPVHPRLKEGCDYVMTVKKTFHSYGEPKKYDEFVTIMKDYKEERFILFSLFLYLTHVVVQGKLCGLLLYYLNINLFSNFSLKHFVLKCLYMNRYSLIQPQ